MPGIETLFLGPFDSNRFWYRVEQENTCGYIGAMDIDFKSPPEFQGLVEVRLCNGEAILRAAEGFDAYVWEDGTTGPDLQVFTPGNYKVSLLQGSCLRSQIFEVDFPENFSIEEIRIQDFTNRNRVEVVISPAGASPSYSLDGGLNFQDTPIFEDVSPGVYELLVQDDCSKVEQTVVVGGLPTFFTPNGDGYNDLWRMPALPDFDDFNLQVYDRFGNLLMVMDEDHPGWDGTFSGVDMPASDYWYRLELPEGRVIQGHFALKR